MKKIKIKENYEYWSFSSQSEFFACFDEMISDGYAITDSFHLCVELTKKSLSVLLSFLPYDGVVDENIKMNLKVLDEKYEIVRPDFDHSMLNIISAIRKHYNQKTYYYADEKITKILEEKKYKNIIIMLLDGMGENVLKEDLKDGCFLKQYHSYTNVAIFPSTTAASTTSTKNGLSPIVTGWLGWENYFHEVKKNLILFTGADYLTEEMTWFDTYGALPYKFFFDDLPVSGQIIEPDFSKQGYNFDDVLKKSLKGLKKSDSVIQYVYYVSPDNLMHEWGTYSKSAKDVLTRMDNDLQKYVEKLPDDTLLIISADHGHIPVEPIDFYACKTLQRMLKRRPSNDSRCISFAVKDEYKKEFVQVFNALFGYAYELYPSSQLIEEGYFGKKGEMPIERSLEFLADYVAIAINKYYFNYKNAENMIFKSHHAGITADEMLVPVIIYRK